MMTEYYPEGGKTMSLYGLTNGHWAGKLYTSKVYLERVPTTEVRAFKMGERMKGKAKALRSICIIPPDELESWFRRYHCH